MSPFHQLSEHRSSSFCVILLTNKQTNRRRWKQYLVGGGSSRNVAVRMTTQ